MCPITESWGPLKRFHGGSVESGGGLGPGALLLPWLFQGCGSVRETLQGSSGL